MLIISKISSAQFNRTFNQDSIFYKNNAWNIKIDTSFIPFDSTSVILKFSSNVNRDVIINYLQLKNLVLIDSLFDYKLCRLDSNWIFSRSLDSIESNTLFEIIELNSSGILTNDPNDSLFLNQTHLDTNNKAALDVIRAWYSGYGNQNIIVAVIDQYPDWSHDDIGFSINDNYSNIWINPKEDAWADPNIPIGDSVDNDGNGLIDDWKGWDFRNNDNDTRPSMNDGGHGTQIAGIIGAKTNNSLGIAGIAGGNNNPGVRIMPINIMKKHSDVGAFFTFFDLAKAINYAAENNADIISLSLNTGNNTSPSDLLDFVFTRAYEKYNVLIFCSSGNYSFGKIYYPSSHPLVYSVGGINLEATENMFTFGDYNNNKILDFVAIGEYIYTTTVGNQYIANIRGTSFASPQVSGIAALILSSYPCLTNSAVYEVMKGTAKRNIFPNHVLEFEFENGTLSNEFGYGIPYAVNALALLNSYELTNYTVSTSEAISSTKIALEDIIVESGGILNISGELQMSEDKKIVVQPGGKLIIDGGKITSGCGWKGIEVIGLATENQNTSSFGFVEIKNNATIEHAMVAIRSIDGGVVQTKSESVFRNNYQSIVFEKYTNNHQHTIIENTKFLCDGPVLKLLKGATGRVQASKEFIRIAETSKINIEDCEFINEFKGKGIYSKVIGVNMYNAKFITIQDANVFNGLSIGINAASLNGLLNFYNIKSNTFTNVDESIKNL
jgi:subtilisin family serine protease